MEHITTNPREYGANYEANKFNSLKTFIFANQRREGFCFCCRQDFSPNELVRRTSGTSDQAAKYTFIFYLCADCDE